MRVSIYFYCYFPFLSYWLLVFCESLPIKVGHKEKDGSLLYSNDKADFDTFQSFYEIHPYLTSNPPSLSLSHSPYPLSFPLSPPPSLSSCLSLLPPSRSPPLFVFIPSHSSSPLSLFIYVTIIIIVPYDL